MNTSETNWTISRGSLNSTVTFESFDFPIDSESNDPKPPLHLLPTHDNQPCEITLGFSQKHEIRQVYIRSTARVYEIYCAPSLQADHDYLCTVRCSPVQEDNESISLNLDTSTLISPKEDDWVEVAPAGQRNAVLQNQDYYEATAEINDSEPCMSLTLRLLSLRTKDCVYVDEVYVFADPVDTDDSENQTERSSASSLMTMLVPTLVGLTKSRSLQSNNHNSVTPVGKPLETEPEHPTLTNPVFVDQRDDKSLKQRESAAELTRIQLPGKDTVCGLTMRNGFSDNRAEVLLEQLVSRVSRIEDICLRFEEKMLKPINSMKARLERVEQQVELLAKNSHRPSCLGFDPNPRSTTSDHVPLCEESELEKKGNGTHESSVDRFVAASTEVPKSPCCDDKEEANDVLVSPKKEQPKKTISIDDALAAALAGFSSFTKSNNDGLTVVPLESPELECLKSNQDSLDTTLGSNSDDEVSISSESATAIPLGSAGEEIDADNNATSPTPESQIVDRDCTGDSITTSSDASIKIPDNSFLLQGTSEVADEEVTGSIPYLSCTSPHDNYITDVHPSVEQDTVKMAKILAFDKTDILKHFPDERVATSLNGGEVNDTVDYESPILEVKFTCENGSHKSYLGALLSNTDDPNGATDEGEINVSAIEERTSNGNNLLVDFDDDCVGEGVGVQPEDIPLVYQETSFTSLMD